MAAHGFERSNWLDLFRGGYFSIVDLETVDLLTVFQAAYDGCFNENVIVRIESEALLSAWLDPLTSHGNRWATIVRGAECV